MALVLSDRIKETTTTTGTGTYTLGGAVSGFETFTANLSNSDTTYYCCTDGTDFEVGLGTFTSSGTTLARTTIISSSNSNNAVSWSSGSRDVFCTLPGSKAVVLDANGALSTGITVQDEGSGLSTTATTLNFVGSGIVASGTGATKTITVTGGGIGTSTANYFDAHTSSDSSALTSSFATIDFDTIRYNSSGSVFSESAGEVTMTTTGIHRIHTDVTTKITSGNSRSDCEIELQRKPSGGSFSQVAGSTAITYNRINDRGEQTSSIDLLYNVTSGDAFRVVAKRQGGSDTIVIQGGAARFNISSVGANPSVATTAADDLTAGDAAINLTTTSGNITIDAQGSDTDIIFKGTDDSSDITALTLDMSNAGAATFNHDVTANGNILAEDGYLGFGDQSGDNWGKVEYVSSNPTDFTSQFGNAVALDNEQGSTNQQLYVFDTSAGNDSDLLGLAASGAGILSITGQGDIKFLRPNNSTSHDITLACPTPSAARTVTLPDATGTVALTSDITVTASSTTTFTNKTLTSPKINEDVAVTATATEINKLDGVNTLVSSSGAIDTDASAEIARAHIGYMGWSDLAGFSHVDQNGQTTYSLLQSPFGKTYLNSASGQTTEIRIGNTSVINVASDGATVTGTLTATDAAIGADTDIMVPIGRADVGAIFTDYAGFRHVDQTGSGDYALLQQSNGNTFVNAADGLNIYFRINNNSVAILHSTHLQLFTGKKLVFEGDTANDHETTLYVTDPTADRTVTLPDATGTVLTTGNSDTPTTTTSSSDADFVLVDDGGTMKKITPSNLGITSGGASKGFAVAMAIAL